MKWSLRIIVSTLIIVSKLINTISSFKMLVWQEGLLDAKYVSSTSTEKYILIVHVVNQSSLIDWLEDSHRTKTRFYKHKYI